MERYQDIWGRFPRSSPTMIFTVSALGLILSAHFPYLWFYLYDFDECCLPRIILVPDHFLHGLTCLRPFVLSRPRFWRLALLETLNCPWELCIIWHSYPRALSEGLSKKFCPCCFNFTAWCLSFSRFSPSVQHFSCLRFCSWYSLLDTSCWTLAQ